MKMKKSLKSIHQSGNVNVESELTLSRVLERLGNGALSQEPDLGAAFLKFAVVTKELSNLKKTLVKNTRYRVDKTLYKCLLSLLLGVEMLIHISI